MRVVIMSGIPGSGKDTYISDRFNLGEKLSHKPRARVYSADDFFIDHKGLYKFNPSKLGDAHGQCLRDFIADVSAGDDDAIVVVNNTNTTAIEIAPYYAVAQAFGAQVQLVTLLAPPDVCAARNIHGVPLAACVAMDKRLRSRELPPFWSFADHTSLTSV